jgi:hypothetical protein
MRFQLVPVLLALAACGHREAPADTRSATVAFADGGAGNAQSLAIQVPGFSAKLDVPGLSLGPSAFDLDGIPLAPGTRVTGMKITGAAGDGSGGEGHGAVDAGFTAPQSPAALLAYYRDRARAGGWTEVPPAAGQQFAATKAKDRGQERFALVIGAAGAGSTGRLLVAGS